MGNNPVSLRTASSLVLIILAVLISCMLKPGEARTRPSVQAVDLGNKQLSMGRDTNATNDHYVEPEDTTVPLACSYHNYIQCRDYCHLKNPPLSYHCSPDGNCVCTLC